MSTEAMLTLTSEREKELQEDYLRVLALLQRERKETFRLKEQARRLRLYRMNESIRFYCAWTRLNAEQRREAAKEARRKIAIRRKKSHSRGRR